jgi:anaerobic selenocysteine-containing dehydrogenase
MIALKVEKIGERIVAVLDDEAVASLGVRVGDTVRLEAVRDGAASEAWIDDPHARGRAFLRRYNRTFERFEG